MALVCLMVWGLIPTRARAGMERVARRKYFSRMYRAPCRPNRSPRPFCRNGCCSLELTPFGGQKLPDEPRRLRQQWAETFPTSFTADTDKWRWVQMKVARRQIKQFLNTGAGVIENAEEHVIAFAVLGQAVDLSQQMAEFLLAEIAQDRAKCLLRGNSQDRATGSSQSWLSPGDVAEEGLHARQPRIARTDRIAASGLQIREKFQHQ